MIPLYIFDLDGTLALIDHRRPILEDTSMPLNERWRKFFAACVDDTPNMPVIAVYQSLAKLDYLGEMVDLEIWSGRSSEVELETRRWLSEYVANDVELKMRQAGDMRPDTELKQAWIDEMSPEDRARLVAVFDDRNSVCQMWRRNNVTVFQVAEGNF